MELEAGRYWWCCAGTRCVLVDLGAGVASWAKTPEGQAEQARAEALAPLRIAARFEAEIVVIPAEPRHLEYSDWLGKVASQ